MTSQRGSGSGGSDPMRAGAQMWEAGYRSLMDGWRQAQEFWSSSARGMGEMTGTWMGQVNRAGDASTNDSMAVLRELQEAALSVAQAWMRLPLTLAGGADPSEMQEAAKRLAEVQGRAYQLWLEAISRASGATMNAAADVARTAGGAVGDAARTAADSARAAGDAASRAEKRSNG